MLHIIKKVEYLEEYKLKLYFNDKSIRIVNLESMLKDAKNMFIPLLDINYFKQVECDGTTICWPNGVDLCPDVLYKMGKDIKSAQSKSSRSKAVSTPRKKPRVKAIDS